MSDLAAQTHRQFPRPDKLARGTMSSVVVDRCQVCGEPNLQRVLFVGYLPPVNTMPLINSPLCEQPSYPADLLICPSCSLAQLGLVVDPAILFPPEYPYTSGTTKILRDNFAQLAEEVHELYPPRSNDLIVDVGSNDGTLLGNFLAKGMRVHGVEPTNAGLIARSKGIATLTAFFDTAAVDQVLAESGPARLVTAANVFAHIEDVHSVVEGIVRLLAPDGLFISESHYLISLLETLQYDTIYHEHLRYYSLTSLKHLLEMHGLQVVHARRIPTHGGSIRVYAARPGVAKVETSVAAMLAQEAEAQSPKALGDFRARVVLTKLGLQALLLEIKRAGHRVYGIGAPSRASTLINYVGLDDGLLDCVLEIPGSYKIGKYIPGTLIPVLPETKLFEDQPEYALLLSWHIADELIPKLKAKGYSGKFLVPLPEPRVVD